MKTATVLEFSAASIGSQSGTLASVQEINWRVAAGDSWVIGGLQGSGKTAILESAAGLRPLRSGRLQLFGQTLEEVTSVAARALRRRVGLVFEGTGRLFGDLTVLENLTLPLCYHEELTLEEAAKKVAPLIEELELTPVVAFRPGRLGYGLSKRVALARALVLRPEILLIDDPLGGLDSAQARAIRRLLHRLGSNHPWYDGQPLTLIVTAEELRPLISVSHQFAVVENRSWHEIGNREALLANASAAVRELLADSSEHLDP